MSLLGVSDLSKSFGSNLIFENIAFEIQPNDRIGLIGRNGCGKTTLFKTLTNELKPDTGEVHRSAKTVVGYMEQHVCKALDRIAIDEVLTVFNNLIQMEEEINQINHQLRHKENSNENLIERQALLNDTFIREGGLIFRAKSKSTLLGLGFTEEQTNLPVGALSGGQRAKLQLAKLLLCGANLLFLDEPTNHLDINSVEWLENFLSNFNGAFVVISHDRYFLDKLCKRIFNLHEKKLSCYKGSYSDFLTQKNLDDLTEQRNYENTQKEIKRLEGIIEQQRRWNREKNIKTAESKQKIVDKLEKNLIVPESKQKELDFSFSNVNRSGEEVLNIKNLSLSFDDNKLFKNVNIDVRRSERIFLLGSNGCGKTSLFKTILNEYKPDDGKITFGVGVKTGYYDQLQTGLHSEKTILNEIWDSYPSMKETDVRKALAMFLFFGDDVYKKIEALSGGEKARVLLLRLMLSKANFLLLDEPTNHLDDSSCEALENALRSYDGTLLIISHDRFLINKLADKIYVLNKNGTECFEGNYEAYVNSRIEKSEEIVKSKNVKEPNDYQLKKTKQAELRKKKADLRRLEEQIDKIEIQNKEIQNNLISPEITADYEKVMKLSQQLEENNKLSENLFEKWTDLSEQIQD